MLLSPRILVAGYCSVSEKLAARYCSVSENFGLLRKRAFKTLLRSETFKIKALKAHTRGISTKQLVHEASYQVN